MLKLLNVAIDVSGNGPDELEAVKKRLHGVRDRLKVTFRDHLKLAVERLQVLNEVLGLSLVLHEALVLSLVLLGHVLIRVVLVVKEVKDALDLRHLELLVERVERGRTARPELKLLLSGQIAALVGLFLLFLDDLLDFFGPVLL